MAARLGGRRAPRVLGRSSRRRRESARTGARPTVPRQGGSASLRRRRSRRRTKAARRSRLSDNGRPRRNCREPWCKPVGAAAGTGSCGTRTGGTPSSCSCKFRPHRSRLEVVHWNRLLTAGHMAKGSGMLKRAARFGSATLIRTDRPAFIVDVAGLGSCRDGRRLAGGDAPGFRLASPAGLASGSGFAAGSAAHPAGSRGRHPSRIGDDSAPPGPWRDEIAPGICVRAQRTTAGNRAKRQNSAPSLIKTSTVSIRRSAYALSAGPSIARHHAARAEAFSELVLGRFRISTSRNHYRFITATDRSMP